MPRGSCYTATCAIRPDSGQLQRQGPDQGLANFLPESKHVRPCGPHGLCRSYSALPCCVKVAADSTSLGAAERSLLLPLCFSPVAFLFHFLLVLPCWQMWAPLVAVFHEEAEPFLFGPQICFRYQADNTSSHGPLNSSQVTFVFHSQKSRWQCSDSSSPDMPCLWRPSE